MDKNSFVVGTADILEMLKISHASFYRVVFNSSSFPKPFKIGLRKNAWLRTDIDGWINARAAEVAA